MTERSDLIFARGLDAFDAVVADAVISLAHQQIDPIPSAMVRGPEGSFGPEIPAPADATPTEAFIAWPGRPPR